MPPIKRGPAVTGAGVVLLLISFGIAFTVFPGDDPTMNAEILIQNLVDDLFDHVSDERLLPPGTGATFSYAVDDPGDPLMWGVMITDFEDGDTVRVDVYDSLGGELGRVTTEGPAAIEVLTSGDGGPYGFEVTNVGERTIGVAMMFAADPENSGALDDPDSVLARVIVPLAASAIALAAGVPATIAGVILLVIDWKKERGRPRSYW